METAEADVDGSRPRVSRNRYWARRARRNVLIAVVSAVALGVVYARVWNDLSLAYRWSMATGYVSVGLIGTALLLGPWWVIRGQRAPISSDSRRDVGLWGAAFALLHVATALQVHMHGDMLQYFMYRARDGHAFSLRLDRFGFANWIGLAATLLLVLLVSISNDRSLRALGSRKWKRLQQSTYVAAILSAAHTIAFQLIARRSMTFVAL